jgi:hypothetical protein
MRAGQTVIPANAGIAGRRAPARLQQPRAENTPPARNPRRVTLSAHAGTGVEVRPARTANVQLIRGLCPRKWAPLAEGGGGVKEMMAIPDLCLLALISQRPNARKMSASARSIALPNAMPAALVAQLCSDAADDNAARTAARGGRGGLKRPSCMGTGLLRCARNGEGFPLRFVIARKRSRRGNPAPGLALHSP